MDGLARSGCPRWAFRWLHDSLVEFSGDRGDQHAGGVETVLVELINEKLVDQQLWPAKIDEIAAGQMEMDRERSRSQSAPKAAHEGNVLKLWRLSCVRDCVVGSY